jgi:putative colanic acid biosysnthesis UDP-glucose lipid carrier transferase
MPTIAKILRKSRTAMIERIADIALASISLFLLCPLLIGIPVAIRLGSPGPVLVRQSRTGLYVFRTTSAPNKRVTGLGSLLQESRLYKLPQLFSVIMGEHSLVNRPESQE